MSNLLNRDDLRALTQIDGAKGVRHLGLHMALILGLALLTTFVSVLFFVPLGVTLGALFPLMHEATHRHLINSIRGNAWLAFACGLILLLPATWFRHFHQAHHRHTQNPDLDPELSQPRPATRRAYVWHLTGLPAWIASLRLVFRHVCGRTHDAFILERLHSRLVGEARAIALVHLGFLLLIIFVDARLIWVTYAPLMIGQMFLRAFLLAEHGGLPFVDQVMDNTRTTRAAAWLRWLTWNMSFHTEHHANPAVPYDKLPAFHQRLRPQTCPSYQKFHASYWQRIGRDRA